MSGTIKRPAQTSDVTQSDSAGADLRLRRIAHATHGGVELPFSRLDRQEFAALAIDAFLRPLLRPDRGRGQYTPESREELESLKDSVTIWVKRAG